MGTLLCKRWGGHFYANCIQTKKTKKANAGVDTFTQTLGWTLLCKLHPNKKNKKKQTLGWTLLRKRWGGHFYANYIQTKKNNKKQTLGWTLLRKRWGGHFYANYIQ